MKTFKKEKVERTTQNGESCDCCGINLFIDDFEHPDVDYTGPDKNGSNIDDTIEIKREIRSSDPYPDGCYGSIEISYDLCPKCYLDIVQKALNERGVKGTIKMFDDWNGSKEFYEVPKICGIKTGESK